MVGGWNSVGRMDIAEIRSVDELRVHYRPPSAIPRDKARATIDAATERFIAHCTFLTIATSGSDGALDVSPRGGEAGFVQVLDATHLAIADLNGNNRLDSLTNVVETGEVGLLLVVVGRDETVRVNGTATVTTDPEVLGSFPSSLRRPKTALVVELRETFVHCAKAFRRGRVWDPEFVTANVDAPDLVQIAACQLLVDDTPEMRAELERGYIAELAHDRPE